MQADGSRNPCIESQVLQGINTSYWQYNDSSQTAPDRTEHRVRSARQSIVDCGEQPNGLNSQSQTDQDKPSEKVPSDWSETGIVPKRNLGLLQAISLVINLIIGSGIFMNSGYVLALTRSKAVCLALWAAGGVYTAICMIVFLEYGTALPYNGGPMIYLDVVFHKPELMAVVIFSVHRVIFGTNESNCRSLAISILLLADPSESASMLSDGAIKAVAIASCTVVCLLLYFVAPLCFVFNGPFAMMKVISLLVLFIAGISASSRGVPRVTDFSEQEPGYKITDLFLAMVSIISSYQGFIDVNCVAGEVLKTGRTLRQAGIVSTAIITACYLLINLAYFKVLDYASLTSVEGQNYAVVLFAEKVFGSSTGVNYTVCLSIFSNLVFTTYTLARVKQAIAWQRIFPFSNFLGRQDKQFDSPGGAIFIHWIFTVVALLSFSPKLDSRNFASGIYLYGYQLIMVLLGVGILRLQGCMREIYPSWNFLYLKIKALRYFVVLVFVASNIFTMVLSARATGPGIIPRWYWPIAVAAVIAVALIYWSALRCLGRPNGPGKKSLGSVIGLQLDVYQQSDSDVPEEMRFMMFEAREAGFRRALKYTVSGPSLALLTGYEKLVQFILKYFGRP